MRHPQRLPPSISVCPSAIPRTSSPRGRADGEGEDGPREAPPPLARGAGAADCGARHARGRSPRGRAREDLDEGPGRAAATSARRPSRGLRFEVAPVEPFRMWRIVWLLGHRIKQASRAASSRNATCRIVGGSAAASIGWWCAWHDTEAAGIIRSSPGPTAQPVEGRLRDVRCRSVVFTTRHPMPRRALPLGPHAESVHPINSRGVVVVRRP